MRKTHLIQSLRVALMLIFIHAFVKTQPEACEPDELKCTSGACVRKYVPCIVINNCTEEATCAHCERNSSRFQRVCNYVGKCLNGSDEKNCEGGIVASTRKENGIDYDNLLDNVYHDEFVTVYFDTDVIKNTTWSFSFLSQAWKYVTKTYGYFGIVPHLYVVLHGKRYLSCKGSYAFVGLIANLNLVDCGLKETNAWTANNTRNYEMLISRVGSLVRDEVIGISNKVDNDICKGTVVDIIEYDILLNMWGKDNPAIIEWKSRKRPKSLLDKYWFRDWFLWIYENYGGTLVIRNYYTLVRLYWKKHIDTSEFKKAMGMGDFIHFWSGAAGINLQPLSYRTIVGSLKYVQIFINKFVEGAKKEFPFFLYSDFSRNATTTTLPTRTFVRRRNNQQVQFSLAYTDQFVAFYFQKFQDYDISSFITISNMWKFVNDNYGPYPYLHILLYNTNLIGINQSCQFLIETKHSNLNVLSNHYVIECKSTPTPRQLLSKSSQQESVDSFDDIIINVGNSALHLPLKNGTNMSTTIFRPSLNISRWSMSNIIAYDIYLGMGKTLEAQRWSTQKLNEWEDFPRNGTYWFRDWYFKIYNSYGRTNVLSNFFKILRHVWLNTEEKTTAQLNMGEFVHFWSGAAGTNLRDLALEAFGWNNEYQVEFTEARNVFTTLNYSCLDCDEFSQSEIMEKGSTDKIMVISVSAVGIAIVLILFFCGYNWKRTQMYQKKIQKLTYKEEYEFRNGVTTPGKDDAQGWIYAMPFDCKWELPAERLVIDHFRIIGSGEFGLVLHGTLKADCTKGSENLEVAVKTVKLNVEISYFKALLSEIKVLASLGHHENVVSLLGTVTTNIKNREVFVALEYCSKGDLLQYLRKFQNQFLNLFQPITGVEQNVSTC